VDPRVTNHVLLRLQRHFCDFLKSSYNVNNLQKMVNQCGNFRDVLTWVHIWLQMTVSDQHFFSIPRNPWTLWHAERFIGQFIVDSKRIRQRFD